MSDELTFLQQVTWKKSISLRKVVIIFHFLIQREVIITLHEIIILIYVQ